MSGKLVNMQGRTFMQQFAAEHTRLAQQVRSLGMADELGYHVVDSILAEVAAGEKAPNQTRSIFRWCPRGPRGRCHVVSSQTATPGGCSDRRARLGTLGQLHC